MDELGIDSTDNANGTYETQHDTPDEVIKKHSETIERVQDQVDRWRRKTARCTGYRNFTKSLTKPDSLLVQVHVLPLGCLS